MKKSLMKAMAVVMLAALLIPPAMLPALAEGDDPAGDRLPPELQGYREELEEARASLQEKMQALRSAVGELREGRRELFSLLREKGGEAREAFASELRSLMRDWMRFASGMRKVIGGVREYRESRRELARELRSGNTEEAVEIIEGWLSRADEAKVRLDGLLRDAEEIEQRQAALIEKLETWEAPEGESGQGEGQASAV